MDLTSCPVSPQRWERKLKSNGATVLCYSICRPSFSDTGKQQRMENYFARLAQFWQTRWENNLYQQASQTFANRPDNAAFLPWQATMNYQVTHWKSPLLSMRIDIQEQHPLAPPVSLCIGEVWDCSDGYPCSLRTFLPEKPRRWKRALTEQLQKQAQARLNSGESLLDPDCCSKVNQTFDPSRFYLTENEVAIFFPQCALGSYGEGIPTFTIPIAQPIQSNKFRALSSTARR